MATGILGVLFFGGRTYKAFRLYLSYRDIAKDLKQIGAALLEALIYTKNIQTARESLFVHATVDGQGMVFCHLDGGTTFEKSLFINTLEEIIAPIDNPKYVIVRKSKFLLVLNQKDYHAVPDVLSRNKRAAAFFGTQWDRQVGYCDLIYTRTIEGRKLLLKARVKSLAAQFEHSVELVNKWR